MAKKQKKGRTMQSDSVRVLDTEIKLEDKRQDDEKEGDEVKGRDGSKGDGQKKSQLYIIMIFVICIAFIVFVFYGAKYIYTPKEKLETITLENGFQFTYYDGLWHTEWQQEDRLYNMHFHFNPNQVGSVLVTGDFDEERFNSMLAGNKTIYVTFNPVGTNLNYVALSAAELSINLARALNVKPEPACTINETEACHIRPIVQCNSTGLPVIYLKEADKSAVIREGICITIQGRDLEMLRAVDRLLFEWYGMI